LYAIGTVSFSSLFTWRVIHLEHSFVWW